MFSCFVDLNMKLIFINFNFSTLSFCQEISMLIYEINVSVIFFFRSSSHTHVFIEIHSLFLVTEYKLGNRLYMAQALYLFIFQKQFERKLCRS